MRLFKPNWVSHEGRPLFSIDVHPDGSRFATGGQGSDSGQVCIWNMAPIISCHAEMDENIPKLLCQMDHHQACVNCVRWSGDGRYLASAGDDRLIMIWQIARGVINSGVFGSGGFKSTTESWKIASTLRGHDGDILDLAWSPQNNYLASSSVDNTVVIWNAKKWHEMTAILKGHSGLVKGVSWDPIGKYIATQSDDKSLRVWRTHDWQEECVITDPFVDCGGTTHVLRLGWSPDGQCMVSAHAMNNNGPTAQIIERGDSWKTTKDFVGHRKAVTCIRFFPSILVNTSKNSTSKANFCCCAIGSRDRSVSVWLTCLKRPLVVIHDLFNNSVLDLSWNPMGTQLLVCSWDGTVACLDFDKNEIGTRVSQAEYDSWCQKLYGKTVVNSGLQTSTLVENVEVLKLQEQMREPTKLFQQNQQSNSNESTSPVAALKNISNASQSNSSRPAMAKNRTDKQIETRLPDGRRRITPLYIPPEAEISESGQQPSFSSSTEARSKIVVEKRESCDVPAFSNSVGAAATTPAKTVVPAMTISSKPSTDAESKASKLNSRVGEKRKPNETTEAPTEKRRVQLVSVPPTTSEQIPQEQVANNIALKTAPIIQHKTTVESASSVTAFPQMALRKPATLKVKLKENQQDVIVEVLTDIPLPGGRSVTKITCQALPTNVQLWSYLCNGKANGLTGNGTHLCIACDDMTLTVLSTKSGRATISPLVLSSPLAFMHCKYDFILVITTDALLSVWDLKKYSCVLSNQPMSGLLKASPGAALKACIITRNAQPLLTFSNGKSFLYSYEMSTWTLLCSVNDPISAISDHYGSVPNFNGGQPESNSPLAVLQNCSMRASAATKAFFHSQPTLQQAGTLTFLDSQLHAARSLESASEYRFWLRTMVQYLVSENLEDRLRELCVELIGPLTPVPNKWQSTVLGINKHELLRSLLPLLASNLKLQRLFGEINDQLDMATSGTFLPVQLQSSFLAKQTSTTTPAARKTNETSTQTDVIEAPKLIEAPIPDVEPISESCAPAEVVQQPEVPMECSDFVEAPGRAASAVEDITSSENSAPQEEVNDAFSETKKTTENSSSNERVMPSSSDGNSGEEQQKSTPAPSVAALCPDDVFSMSAPLSTTIRTAADEERPRANSLPTTPHTSNVDSTTDSQPGVEQPAKE